MIDVKDTLRQFILDQYLPGESASNVRDDTRLLSSGILDSLAVLGLASFIERTFGVELTVQETSVDTFDRIEEMAALIQRKRVTQETAPFTR